MQAATPELAPPSGPIWSDEALRISRSVSAGGVLSATGAIGHSRFCDNVRVAGGHGHARGGSGARDVAGSAHGDAPASRAVAKV